MNYYDFLYRWTPYPSMPGYFYFCCLGVCCQDCAFVKDFIAGNGCRSPRYVYGWDRILKDANELLEEGWLYK